MLITGLNITNFRSLHDVTIPGLTTANVFHGPNNSGKSNILLALRMLLSQKVQVEELSVSGEPPLRTERTTQFWYGRVLGLGESYYRNTQEPMRFSINISIGQEELANLPDAAVFDSLLSPGHDVRIVLSGRVDRQGDDGEMILERMTLNRKDAFVLLASGGVNYLPRVDGDAQTKENAVRAVLDYFNDSVYIVPSARYLTTELPSDEDSPALTAVGFKNWLHSQSLSKEGYEVFSRIKTWFNEPPFAYGELSFLREPRQLEIMINDASNFRLPIDAKGTGVQQILILLSYIAVGNAKVIGVEEPELNLSFANQDAIVTKLMSLIRAGDGPHQLLLTSHSDHVGSRGDLKQYHVSHDGTSTAIRRFVVGDRQALFPRLKWRRNVLYN